MRGPYIRLRDRARPTTRKPWMKIGMIHAPDVPDDIARAVISPRSYAEDAPVHDAFRWIRANVPLGKATIEGIYPFWIVSRHADILEISRQNELFRSGDMP